MLGDKSTVYLLQRNEEELLFNDFLGLLLKQIENLHKSTIFDSWRRRRSADSPEDNFSQTKRQQTDYNPSKPEVSFIYMRVKF